MTVAWLRNKNTGLRVIEDAIFHNNAEQDKGDASEYFKEMAMSEKRKIDEYESSVKADGSAQVTKHDKPQNHVSLNRVLSLIDEYNTGINSTDLEHRRAIQKEQTKEYAEEQYEKYKAELGLND